MYSYKLTAKGSWIYSLLQQSSLLGGCTLIRNKLPIISLYGLIDLYCINNRSMLEALLDLISGLDQKW